MIKRTATKAYCWSDQTQSDRPRS